MIKTLEKHTVSSYDEELKQLVAAIRDMEGLLEKLLDCVAESLKDPAASLADTVKEVDQKINALDRKVEQKATRILALRNPLAVDLRLAISALKVATILERMGDLAKNSTRRVVGLEKKPSKDIQEPLEEMVELVKKMLRNSVSGFRKLDTEKADKVWKREDKVDALTKDMFDVLTARIQADSSTAADSMRTLLVAKNLERIGDYATAIAKIVHYMSSGERQ